MEGFHRYHLIKGSCFICNGKLSAFEFLECHILQKKKSLKCCNGFDESWEKRFKHAVNTSNPSADTIKQRFPTFFSRDR